MTKVDQLIEKFKEFKEELNKACPCGGKTNCPASCPCPSGCKCKSGLKKNMNGAMNPGMHQPNATTGTSGGQGGMYRSEDMDKAGSNCAGGAQDMMQMSEDVIKFDKNGQWSLDKSAFKKLQHKIEGQGHSPESAAAITASIGRKELGQKEMTARSKAGMKKVDPEENINIEHPQNKAKMTDGVNKEDDSYVASDGKNREANPKLRGSDMGPGGKVHMVKEEGTNDEANPDHPHNKGKFKVMDMAAEKESKKAATTGLPYSGKDKDVHKGEHQGNESKGFDENKAPGRGTLSV